MYILLGILTVICIGLLLILCTQKILISKELVDDKNYYHDKQATFISVFYTSINIKRFKYTYRHLLSNKTTIKYKTFATFISTMYADKKDFAFTGTMELKKWKFDSLLDERDFFLIK